MAALWNLHMYFPEEFLYMIWQKFVSANHYCPPTPQRVPKTVMKKYTIFVIGILSQQLYKIVMHS